MNTYDWVIVGILGVGTVAGVLTGGAASTGGAGIDEGSDTRHGVTGVDPVETNETTAPEARLVASENSVHVNESLRLDATNSTTDADRIVECDFDLDGDGTWETFGDDDCIVTLIYPETGEYEPTVRVWDSSQQSDVASTTVTVTENDPPTANFTWSPNTPSPGEPVDFDANDSRDADGQIVEYRWDFDGDGSVDTVTQVPEVTHGFDSAKTYPVTLTVVDDDGANDTTTRSVAVEDDPNARCSVSATEVEPGEQVIIDASDSNADLVRIDIEGDGEPDRTNDDDFREVVTYADPGDYTPVVRAQVNQQIDTQQCPTISVAENQGPDAEFTVAAEPGTAGEPMIFDASDAVDPDGDIVEYRWDWNDDGNPDETTTVEIVRHAFDEPGQKTVRLTVVDDDGATDTAVLQGISVQEAPRCTVSKDEVLPGESLVIEVSGEPVTVEFDTDGDGDFNEFLRDGVAITHSYDETGTYYPSARVTDERQRTTVVECGQVSVVEPPEENSPPNARLRNEPATVETNETVLLDASGSYDRDGRIRVYKWDLDNDGEFEVETRDATLRHRFTDSGAETVSVEVVDTDGATDDATADVEIVERSGSRCEWVPGPYTPSETVCEFLPPVAFVGAGSLGGLALCRVIDRFRTEDGISTGSAQPRSGLTDYAVGTIELPPAGEAVSVTDLGFEPDLVVLTASNAVVTAGPREVGDTSVGWSYGAAERTGDGAIAQHVVSVAEDARHPEFATAAASHGDAVFLPTFDGDRVDGDTARIDRTTAGGFELSVPAANEDDTAEESGDRVTGRPVVLFRAFGTEQPEDVEVGFFRAPAEQSEQSVEIGPAANHVTLTTCTALDDLDVGRATEDTVGISTGEVVGGETLQQVVTAGAVAPSAEGVNNTVAAEDRAIHLLYQSGPVVAGRTTAKATSLDDGLVLDYDSVHAEGGATPSDGHPLISYVAMDAGGAVPTVGYFELPGPDERGSLSVATGFEPGLVEFTVCDVDNLGERVGAASPYPWGRSHGVAMKTTDGIVQHLLHGAVDPDWNFSEPSPSAGTFRAEGVGAGLSANGGTDARITGRDDLSVTAFTPTGFDVRTTHVSTDARDPGTDSGKLVFYKAWPNPAQ